jgi:helicase
MTPELVQWIGRDDALRHMRHFGFIQLPVEYNEAITRQDDYFVALVGELFDAIRLGYEDANAWARLGNAFLQLGGTSPAELMDLGINREELMLYAAAAFYFGGFPASAMLTLRAHGAVAPNDEVTLTSLELLSRPREVRSPTVNRLLAAVRNGDSQAIRTERARAADEVAAARSVGPSEWIAATLRARILARFQVSNLRAVLPDGDSQFWNTLVRGLTEQNPPIWEFFPSQIEAIQAGLLNRNDSFSLQMPTGAGKTALCETLLYSHLMRTPEAAAVLLVPYRSLASELKQTLVPRLNRVGILSRAIYGGSVPTPEELHALGDLRAVIATPEALIGALNADAAFFSRISLVICDEGHLLDSAGRGIALELLLARMRGRAGPPVRFVFISAIVPNIEEINAWLRGGPDTVVRSGYRPAFADFSVLRPLGNGAQTLVGLEMHPADDNARFLIEEFLTRRDFQYQNPQTGRTRTYGFGSVSTRAIGAARKALPMGSVAVFAANKRGNQGAVGLAEELLSQLHHPLALPRPSDSMIVDRVSRAADYVSAEYGQDWVGTRALQAGAVLHHGDIPQETREVLEGLVRDKSVPFAICTSTLAEGVNLPIRTLVLYSVSRRLPNGRPDDLKARDIKNLVGRAGRAGSSTKGLVICANENQWHLVAPVARNLPGEVVSGDLRQLIGRLQAALARNPQQELNNELLEAIDALFPLVDGIDATLLDLAAEEIGADALANIATDIASHTWAHRAAGEPERRLLESVFNLRARRVVGVRDQGRLDWVRSTGARLRMIDSVERHLLPLIGRWQDIEVPTSGALVAAIVGWALDHHGLRDGVKEALHIKGPEDADPGPLFLRFVGSWLAGARFAALSAELGVPVDDLLGLYTKSVSYDLQTLAETSGGPRG